MPTGIRPLKHLRRLRSAGFPIKFLHLFSFDFNDYSSEENPIFEFEKKSSSFQPDFPIETSTDSEEYENFDMNGNT